MVKFKGFKKKYPLGQKRIGRKKFKIYIKKTKKIN